MVTQDAPSESHFTFSKEERLSRKKLIDELFKNGSSFYLYPFKVQYLPGNYELDIPAQVLIAVPNKNFPKAVDRNKLKRLTREAYRLNKNSFYEELKMQQKKLLVAFIYTSKKKEPFTVVQEKMISILKRLSQNNATAEKNIE